MPIKGLTDKHTAGTGLPLLGTLYKGDPKTEKRPGKDRDDFRMEFKPEFEHLRETWLAMHGTNPDTFDPVFLAYPTTDEVFPAFNEEWTATAMLHKCDGETQIMHYNQQAGMYSHAKIDCVQNSDRPCACKPTGRLNLIFSDFIEAVGVLGYISVTTHSIHDILRLTKYLRDIESIYGQISGIPMVFGRATRPISVPKPNGNPGDRMIVKKSLLYIHANAQGTQNILLPHLTNPGRPALPATTQTPPEPELPQLDVQTAKSLLGNGSSRRIGKATPVVETVSEAVIEETPDNWTYDKDSALNFEVWVRGHFGMDLKAVFDAMSITQDAPVKKLTDFDGSKELAMAAAVAAKASYNIAEISKLTRNRDIFPKEEKAVDIYGMACEIAEMVMSPDEE